MRSPRPAPMGLPLWMLRICATVLAFFVLLIALSALGVTWSRAVVISSAALILAVALLVTAYDRGRIRSDPEGTRHMRDGTWHLRDGTWHRTGHPFEGTWHRLELLGGGTVLAIFAVATQAGWNVMSDYVFHWGMKGRRFAAVGGLDFDFLALPWHAHLHPDYPNLLPTLYGAGFVLTERTDWTVVAPWSILFFVLFLGAGRSLARDAISDPAVRVLGLGTLWAACLAFAVQPMVAGGADLPLAVAVLLACHALLLPTSCVRDRALQDLHVGLVAAFAAACKLEGMPLAATLIGLHGLKIYAAADGEHVPRLRRAAASVARAAALPAIVVGLWLGPVLTHGLFLESNTAGLDLGRLPTVIRRLAVQLVHPVWHGMPVVLLGLPLALWKKGPRRLPALLLLIQSAFYVYVYLAGPVDTELWIRTSASRLFLHVVPAATLLVLGTVSTSNDDPVSGG